MKNVLFVIVLVLMLGCTMVVKKPKYHYYYFTEKNVSEERSYEINEIGEILIRLLIFGF